MESRQLKSREYNTDVLNAKNGHSNGANTLYDPHPYLRDRMHSDNRARTSFQDSNIFTYKEGNNVTWQNTGRDDKPAGIRSGVYVNAHKSTDNVIYDPSAPMAGVHTATRESYVQPTPEMYHHNDPTVPKSRLGAEIFGVQQFDRQAVRKDLLPQDEFWLRHTDKTKDGTPVQQLKPQDRRQLELHSSQSNYQPVPYQPAPKEYRNETLSSWVDPHKSDKRSNVPTEVNTFERRAQELSSVNNPLTAQDYSEYTPKTKGKGETFEDVEKRVKDAFYSDMYGQTGKYGDRAKIVQRSEISSHTGIFSKEGASKGNRWNDDVTPAQRRQDFMRSSAFPSTNVHAPQAAVIPDQEQINMAKAELRMPKVVKASELQSRSLHSDEFNQKYNVIADHREINVFSLIFNNLPKDMDSMTLKAMSGAKHVVRVSVETDNIKNECTGKGEITIRLFEGETKEEIVNRFLAAGLNVQDKPEDAGKRKSNYHELASTGWRDSRLEFEEKRHMNTGWEGHKLSKVAQLSTNLAMGTNEDIANMNREYADLIRNRQDGLYEAQKGAETHNLLMSGWNNMRPQTASAGYSGGSMGDTAFMKPTESFNQRSRLVQDSLRKKYY